MNTVRQEIIPVGAVYCLNHYYTKEWISRDIATMAESGLNMVMLWPMIEWDTRTQQPDFSRIDHVFYECEKRGLKVVAEMVGEIPELEFAPSWKMAGLGDGSFDINSHKDRSMRPNLNHPEVKKILAEYIALVVERYKDRPSLLAWDVWDEPDPVFADDLVLNKYRAWLKEKYGTLEKLNAVWGHTWTDWQQVQPWGHTWISLMPRICHDLFRIKNMADVFGEMVSTVKQHDTRHPVYTHPFYPMLFFGGYPLQDDWQMARHTDYFGLSFYHKEDWPGDLEQPWHTAAVLSCVRSAAAAAGKQYLLPEVQSNQRTGYSTHGFMDRRDIELTSWQSFAQESKGIIFWKWDPFQQGLQNQGRGLTDMKGASTVRAEAAGEVSRVVGAYDGLFQTATLVQTNVGILYDVGNSLKTGTMGSIYSHLKEMGEYPKKHAYGIYRDIWQQGYNADFVRSETIAEEEMAGINVLFASFQQLLGEKTEAGLHRFVEQGGVFMADARFGNNSDDDITFTMPPGELLSRKWGVTYVNAEASRENKKIKIISNHLAAHGLPKGSVVTGGIFREKFEKFDGWEVLGVFTDTKEPALITRAIGKGRVYLAVTNLGLAAYTKPPVSGGIWSAVLRAAHVQPAVMLPPKVRALPVEAQLQKTGKGSYLLYLMNWGPRKVVVPATIPLPGKKAKATVIFPLNEKGPLPVSHSAAGLTLNVTLPSRHTKVVVIE